MKSYKTVNNLFGWLCFIIAAVTYCLTVEPSASFWDCPEFILSGNTDKVKPFCMIWKKAGKDGAQSRGTVAVIPADYFYQLISK